ncbi:MAG: M24 family metallopeptidase [Bryobacteraceae bacterium]
MELTQIQNAIREEGLDGWLFFDHHHRDPLAYRILHLQHAGLASRRWYYFIPASGEPRALVHAVEPHALDELPGARRIYSAWTSQRDGLVALLSGARRVAMQFSPNCAVPLVAMVDGGTIDLIRSCGVEVATSADLIQRFDAVWSKEQAETHFEAGRRMDEIRAAAFAYVGDVLRGGGEIDEYAVKMYAREAFDKAGLVTDHGPVAAVNANISNPHYEPEASGSAPIRRGDVLLMDMWAKLNTPGAVYYDITWTGFCGATPPDEVVKVFTIVRDARDRAFALVRDRVAAGRPLRGFEVDDAARRHIADNGYAEYFVHRTGHSIGEEVHGTGANMDNLETHDERKVIPGTCFSVEPGIYLERFGIRSEYNVYVSETEARVTGAVQTELIKVVE